MSDTPRTDRVLKNCNGWHHVPIELARELERELAAAQQRIQRLEQAGDAMAVVLVWSSGTQYKRSPTASAWRKAKEAKP